MISSGCDISQFVEAVRDRDYFEVIAMADREALDAWRRAYHGSDEAGSDREKGLRYTGLLEGLIDFVRYGVEPAGLSSHEAGLLHCLCRRISEKSLGPLRC
jgi:hypothetical protein